LRKRKVDKQFGPIGAREELLLHELHPRECGNEQRNRGADHPILQMQDAIEQGVKRAGEARRLMTVTFHLVRQDENACERRKQHSDDPRRFERADGRAVLSIYPNENGETPAAYLKHNLRMERSALDYTRITRSFFAISSEREGVVLYSRCNFSGGGRGAIHCFDLKYPQAEKRSWDPVVTRISLSLRRFAPD
jgi:hypothetical protein